MPNAAKRICNRCRTIVDGPCPRCTKARAKTSTKRGTTSERGYDSIWRKMSERFRAEHPLCGKCAEANIVRASECVDHVIPHEGKPELLYNWDNLQALCWSCHSRKTRKETCDKNK